MKTIKDFEDLNTYYPYAKITPNHYENGLDSSQIVPYKHKEFLFVNVPFKVKNIKNVNILYFLLENSNVLNTSSDPDIIFLSDDQNMNFKYQFFKKEIINLVKTNKISSDELNNMFKLIYSTNLIENKNKIIEFFIENKLIDINKKDSEIKGSLLKEKKRNDILENFKNSKTIAESFKYYIRSIKTNSIKVIREINSNQDKYKDLIKLTKNGVNKTLLNTIRYGNSESLDLLLGLDYFKNNKDLINKAYCYTSRSIDWELKNKGKYINRDIYLYKNGFKNDLLLNEKIEKNVDNYTSLLILMIEDGYIPSIKTLYRAEIKNEYDLLIKKSNEEIDSYIINNPKIFDFNNLSNSSCDNGYTNSEKYTITFTKNNIVFIFNLLKIQREKNLNSYQVSLKKLMDGLVNANSDAGIELINLGFDILGKEDIMKNMPFSNKSWAIEIQKQHLLDNIMSNGNSKKNKIKI